MHWYIVLYVCVCVLCILYILLVFALAPNFFHSFELHTQTHAYNCRLFSGDTCLLTICCCYFCYYFYYSCCRMGTLSLLYILFVRSKPKFVSMSIYSSFDYFIFCSFVEIYARTHAWMRFYFQCIVCYNFMCSVMPEKTKTPYTAFPIPFYHAYIFNSIELLLWTHIHTQIHARAYTHTQKKKQEKKIKIIKEKPIEMTFISRQLIFDSTFFFLMKLNFGANMNIQCDD